MIRDKRGARVRRVGGRVMDYTDAAMFPLAAEVQRERRGGTDHEYVIGGFRMLDDGRVCLACVERGPAWDVRERLTCVAAAFARWRTKQAAWQWLRLRPWLDARVIHLGRLDVLPGGEDVAGVGRPGEG